MPSNLDFHCPTSTSTAPSSPAAQAASAKPSPSTSSRTAKKVILAGRTEAKLADTTRRIGAAAYYVVDVGDTRSLPRLRRPPHRRPPRPGLRRQQRGRPAAAAGPAPAPAQRRLAGHGRRRAGHQRPRAPAPDACRACAAPAPAFGVVEIAPPQVGTHLHRERDDPDDNKKENNEHSMTVDEFIRDMAVAFARGDDMITAGMGKDIVGRWYSAFGDEYEKASTTDA
ncbi:hypothetical protein E4U21_005614 [Claviceps maximensis]|nr:hypothetical protein E4U21_005614 [Claviceps maximensis]